MSRRTRVLGVSLASYLALAFAIFVGCNKKQDAPEDLLPETNRPERQAAASPNRCAKCHADQHSDWLASHHAVANRKLHSLTDAAAFSAPLTEQDASDDRPAETNGQLLMPPPKPGDPHVPAKGVLGYKPLRQYLVEADGGRLQAHSLAFDPEKSEWFDIFENDGRQAGEWGHWSGQGMNWNSNCAWCHMTEFDKNYDIGSDSYHSEWTAQSVSCLQCHSQAIEHADAAELGKAHVSADPYELSDRSLSMQNCATCHSRRDDLSGGQFVAGDHYADHYGLALPDQPGLYFPDFKALDEDYVYASLQLSPMGHAGVSCMDCHNPHSGGFVAPRENNALCVQCHSTGKLDAPIIQPTAHSRHGADSTGNSCIECHMPTRTYMGRDPRHDHGFTIPDPQLTLEFETPNACNQCHSDQSVEWAAKAFEEWYPTPTVSARREHARMMAQAWNPSQPFPTEALLEAYEKTENPYRLATYVQLFANAGFTSDVLDTGPDPSESSSPILRAAAVRLLANDPNKLDRLGKMLTDPRLNVRLVAAQATLRIDPTAQIDQTEVQTYLDANSDRPQTRLQLAQEASLAGDSETAFRHVQVAASFDRVNSMVYYQGAIALAGGGHLKSAQIFLSTAPELATKDGWIDYANGLLWAEQNDLARSLSSIQKAVEKDPSQDRWWYNLVAAQMGIGNNTAAQATLRRALAIHPDSPALQSLMQPSN